MPPRSASLFAQVEINDPITRVSSAVVLYAYVKCHSLHGLHGSSFRRVVLPCRGIVLIYLSRREVDADARARARVLRAV